MEYITDNTKKELINFIIPIMCLLTIEDTQYDINYMYLQILKNETIKQILENYIFNYIEFNILDDDNIDDSNINIDFDIWYRKLDIQLDYLNNYAFKIKQELYEAIKNPRKLLKLIDIYTNFIDYKIKIDNEKVLINFNTLPSNISNLINKFLEYDITGFYSIDNFLDKIPEYKWYNKNYKWLIDTENNGVYCIVVFLRLMKSLIEYLPNTYERKQYILENMIYIYKNYDERNNFWCKYILDPFNEFKLNFFDNRKIVVNEKNSNSYIKFDIVIYNTWISSPLTQLWQELKNIIFRLSKKKGLIVFTNYGIRTPLFNNMNSLQNDKLKLEVYRKMINNYLHIYEISYLGSIKFEIDKINYSGYIIEKTKFKTTINIDGMGEIRLV